MKNCECQIGYCHSHRVHYCWHKSGNRCLLTVTAMHTKHTQNHRIVDANVDNYTSQMWMLLNGKNRIDSSACTRLHQFDCRVFQYLITEQSINDVSHENQCIEQRKLCKFEMLEWTTMLNSPSQLKREKNTRRAERERNPKQWMKIHLVIKSRPRLRFHLY